MLIASPAVAQKAGAVGNKNEIVNVARATFVNEEGIEVAIKSSPVRALREKPAPAVKLAKTASDMAPMTGSEVAFTVRAVAGPQAVAAQVDATVDGQPQMLVVLRDGIPVQTQFVRFESGTSAATQLYHSSGDPLHSYSTTPPADLKRVDAVALGMLGMAAGERSSLRFSVRVGESAKGTITNTAKLYSTAMANQPLAVTLSNTVTLAPTVPPDPFGIVFDSRTNTPVAGVRVTLIDSATGAPARVFGSDGSPAPNVVVTGTDGRYSFPLLAPGSYILQVLPPPGHTAPSKMSPVDMPSGRALDPNASFGLSFVVDPSAGALQYDIPVDAAGDGAGLFVQKLASRQTAEIGDFVDYTVRVRNVSGRDLEDVTLDDELPQGFVFQEDSARSETGRKLRSASGSRGPRIKLSLGELPADKITSVSYRVRIGAGALQGDGINRAQASAPGQPPARSNIATAQVQLQEGVFTSRGVVLGKVFADLNRNRIQDAGEPGIPGVRLFIEDGSYVITDGEGKYSFYGITPRLHVLKLDKVTLPPDAELMVLDTRNAGTAGTRFVDLKKSEMHKANFAIGNATAAMLTHIEKLRLATEKLGTEGARTLKAELTRDGNPLLSGAADRRAQPASGVIVPGVAVQPTQDMRTEGAGSLILGDQRFNLSKGASNQRSFTQPLFQDPVPEQSASTTAPSLTRASAPMHSIAPPAPASLSQSAGAPPSSLSFEPILPTGAAGSADDALFDVTPGVGATLPVIPIQTAAASTPATASSGPAFLDLRDGDTLPMAQTTIRVQGRVGGALRLHVNGEEVPPSRIGKRVTTADAGTEVLEFIGVTLTPGTNELEIAQVDPFGNPRGATKIQVIAPDKLGQIKLTLPSNEQPADGHTPARVRVELLDANGVPVTVRTELTLEATMGAWQATDLNPEAPGVQVFLEGGRAEFDVAPPVEPGDCKLRVSSGSMHAEQTLPFLPDLRPMLAAGIVEGRVNLTNFNAGRLTRATKRDGFEDELRELSIGNDERSAAGRAAFFLKGKVKGDYLLTAAYDSEREVRERLFRDIQPDEFYPVYGDSSVRGFEAQSTGPLYVRIDKKRSYLLYGDFVTQAPGDFRQLGAYNRSLTGVREHFENSRVSANAWASYDSTRQIIEELRANGTSGPYLFNVRNGNGLVNSEKVEIITRARNNPGLILRTEPKTRFSDYEFEPFTGRILFKGPVPSLDADLNPISIRVTYEIDQGGDKFWTYGGDAQLKLTNRLEVGGAFAREENPLGKFGLYSGNAVFQIARSTFLLGEVARTEDEIFGSGNAYRFELRHTSENVAARLFWGKADPTFRNPAALLTSGGTEGAAQIAVKLAKNTRLLIEGVDTESAEGGTRRGAAVALEQTFRHDVRLEVGGRYSVESGGPASASTALARDDDTNTIRSARAKLTLPVPFTAGAARVFGEYEQDLFDSEKRMAAIGGDYQVDPKTRLYARHELISSLGGPFELNTLQEQHNTVIGVESTYMKDAQLFNEYRVRNAISGRDAEAAIGLRNTWPLAPGLRANTSFERVAPIGGAPIQQEATAVTGALEYTANSDWKGTARLELRTSDATDSLLNTMGVAWKLSRDWTALGKTILYLADNKAPGAGDQTQARIQAGVAWRQTETDQWNALGKYEFKTEEDETKMDFNVARKVHIVSLDGNYQPTPDFILSGHYAGKLVFEDSNGINGTSSAHLLASRVTYDLTRRWDIGLNASALVDGSGGHGIQYGLGPEVGFTLLDNLRVAVGYNFLGFEDRDLSESQYTQSGFYIAMRFKFDEELWQRRKKEAGK
ncbi:MAG TPA: hypothetical protein VF614_08020 [Chthoniobacteraceae bacterium]